MALEDQLFTIALMVGCVALAVALTFGVLAATGRLKTKPNELGAARIREMRRRIPELAALPEEDQRRIVRQSAGHPLIWGVLFLFVALAAWAAVTFPPLLDFINSSWRMAAVLGVVCLAALLPLVFFIQGYVVRQKIRAHQAGQRRP